MSDNLELILRGADAEAAAADLEAALAGEDAPLSLARRREQLPPSDGYRAIDPVAVTALVLSIPSALLAAWDIADRIRKRAKAQVLKEQAQRLRIERGVECFAITLEGPRALDKLTADQIMELAGRGGG